MESENITLIDNRDGSRHEFPKRCGTLGPVAVDISSLYKKAGIFTYDPGYMSTASCHSAITYIDGENGILLYRGYPIEQLAAKASFLEVAYLLVYGELPNVQQLSEFGEIITHHTMLNESLKTFLDGFHYDAHPMAILCGVVASLSGFYKSGHRTGRSRRSTDGMDLRDPYQREIAAHRVIAKVPTIAAAAYKHNVGEPIMYPRNDLQYGANFLHMLFATPCEKYKPSLIAERAINLLFILHADHEQNASTSTVRLAASSGANPFACIAAGIASLWGPAHGGANEAVLDMLEVIGDVSNVPKYLAKAKDKDDPFRLMGFGHRVYKDYDPRAKIIREICHQVLDEVADISNPLFELALKLEEVALTDEYFVERKLYPNVDFYSGIIYQALGIPSNMFTVVFAVARSVGWISHWLEMAADPHIQIGRPRQIYCGPAQRDYLLLPER